MPRAVGALATLWLRALAEAPSAIRLLRRRGEHICGFCHTAHKAR